ncbi:MAG: hypothetical protein ACTSSG_02085 [Candidatus Heimdallarchaeaceae archaeon]
MKNELEEASATINMNGLVKLPAIVTDEDKSLLFKELTTILSRRWLKDKVVVFGCSETDLLLATKFDLMSLNELLLEYKEFVKVLGLEVVEYLLEGKKWYCLKSNYYAPSELEKAELVVLGTVISLLEESKKQTLSTRKIKETLVVSKKMKEYLVEQSLRKLAKLGYLKRHRNEWSYSYRALIEFGQDERKKIAEEFRSI